MGQYYRVALKDVDGNVMYNSRRVFNRKGEPLGYIMAKLLEHSYFGNYLVDSVANVLENESHKLAWVGDYSEEDVKNSTNGDVNYEKIWGEGENYDTSLKERFGNLTYKRMFYKGKYLVNHTKGLYISFDEYRNNCKKQKKIHKGKNVYELSPIPILTAIGNGMGGGDYHGMNEEYVGSWVWDEISIEHDITPYENFEEFDKIFVAIW